MYSCDEEMYDGGYSYEEYSYDEDPGYDLQGYSGGEETCEDDADEYPEQAEEYPEGAEEHPEETDVYSEGEEYQEEGEEHSEAGEEYPEVDEEYSEEDEEYSEESNSGYNDDTDGIDEDDDGIYYIRMGYGSGSDLASGPGLLSYEPTTLDILQVRHYFSLIPVALPKELVDIILDYASYWTHSSLTLVKTASIADGGYMYLRTLPLAFPNTEGNFIVSNQELHGSSARSGKLVMRNGLSGTHPCRRIEFQLWSHDQGWSSWPENQGTYRASWTWFDACIESPSPPSEGMAADWPAHLCIGSGRDSSPMLQSPVSFVPRVTEEGFPESAFLQVQKNVHASALTRHHIVTWHYLDSVEKNSQDAQNAENRGQDWKSLDGSFVQRMQRGDCIALWMRARYPGWTCTIRKAKITVHWAV